MRLTVQRFDPAVDAEPSWASYEVDVAPHRTVLDALLMVADRIDPTLAFRRTCRSGICGACGGLVDGQARLFCQARVGDAREIAVRPLPGFRILKDLVVDMDPFFDAFARAAAWLVPAAAYDGVVPPDTLRRMWGAAGCVLCGVCVGRAPAPDGSHPAVVARVLRLAADPRDALGAARLAHLDDPDRYDARFADALRAVCPKAVDVSGLTRVRSGAGEP
jgi:succinate dehydrogenase / fumarate reductase iron-sulfur subunit